MIFKIIHSVATLTMLTNHRCFVNKFLLVCNMFYIGSSYLQIASLCCIIRYTFWCPAVIVRSTSAVSRSYNLTRHLFCVNMLLSSKPSPFDTNAWVWGISFSRLFLRQESYLNMSHITCQYDILIQFITIIIYKRPVFIPASYIRNTSLTRNKFT